ncbi:MAG: secondary thiamine-phosphate synthase [Bacteroides sp. SM23_62_1]|nr:MAG: secondary thiamine-phosphate synthase [Bacteroides sp. SM23_62_1]
MIYQTEITLPSLGKGYHLITRQIMENLPELPETGLINIMLKHTSAAITINENADPTVRQDFESFMARLVPEGTSYFVHTLEGDDDMPAHIKASLIGQSVTIPITNHRLNLGTWQGIYLCEFRKHAGHRQLVLTVYC